jgi:hypothetical protein
MKLGFGLNDTSDVRWNGRYAALFFLAKIYSTFDAFEVDSNEKAANFDF